MRIWAFPYIYPYDFPGMKSSGIFAHRQYKGLIKNGAELKALIPMPWNPPFPFYLLHEEWKQFAKYNFPKKRVYEGVEMYHPRVANMRPNRFVKKSYEERFIDAVVNFFKDNKITLDPANDIIYSQWTPNSYYVQKAAHRLGLKSAILCIGDDVILFPNEKPESLQRFMETWTGADLRFVVADYVGRLANKTAGADMPYDVIMMGAEYEQFKPGTVEEILQTKKAYNIPPDKPIILTIGTASKRKGWIELFDALEVLKQQNVDFFAVGIHTGAHEIDFASEIEKRGLSSCFLGMNGVPPETLNKIYNTADIFCLPTHSEGMANVVIEAMSSGLAVLTTDVGGHNEIVNNGVNGILVPAHNAEVLAEKLLALLKDKERRETLGAAARTFIVNEWGTFADTSKLLYSKMSALLSGK